MAALVTAWLSAVLAAASWAAAGPYPILKDLVRRDQRYAGAPRRAQAIAHLERLMKDRGLQVSRDSFTAKDPKTGQPRPMTNLIGHVRPGARCRLLLGSHFDIRHVAEEDPDAAKRGLPIPGANDGSSGVAVLLDLAAKLPRLLPKGVGADVDFFDGEEMGYPDVGGYCLGSQHYARGLAKAAVKPRFGIILDMVCDPRGIYYEEKNSLEAAPGVTRAVWEAGRAAAPEAFDPEPYLTVIDDHVSLTDAGVPSILVIGFNYPEWHTSADTLDKCSPKRLDEVERTLELFVQKKLPGLLGDCR